MGNTLVDERIINALKCVQKETIAFSYDKEQRRFEYVTGKELLDLIHRLQDDYSKLKERYVKVLDLNEKVIAEQKAEIERLTRESDEMFDRHAKETQAATLLIEKRNNEIAELQKQVDELTELKTVKIVDGNGLCITFFHKNEEVGEASVCDYQGREDNFLHGIEVKEQYRGKGYGRMIVEYMTTHYPVDTLYVEKANNTAIRLYERFGFALTCDTFDKDGKTMAVMARGQELYQQAVKDTAKEIYGWLKEHTIGGAGWELVKTYFREKGVEVE